MCNQTITTFTCCQREETTVHSQCRESFETGICNINPHRVTDPGPCLFCRNVQMNAQIPQQPSPQPRPEQITEDAPEDESDVRSPFPRESERTYVPIAPRPSNASATTGAVGTFQDLRDSAARTFIHRDDLRQIQTGTVTANRPGPRSQSRGRGRSLMVVLPTRGRPAERSDMAAGSGRRREGRTHSARQAAEAGGQITRLPWSEEVSSPEESPIEEMIQAANALARQRDGNGS